MGKSHSTGESKRRQTEETLRKLSRAVEQSPSTVVITDLEGNIEYVNPKFTEITGYEPEEVIGKNPRILKSGKQPPELYKELWDTITSGGEWRGEFHNKKKNGEFYWEHATISSITDEKGVITHFLKVAEDITERKQTEEALKQAHERFLTVLDSLDSGVYVADMDTYEVLFANQHMRNTFGDVEGKICWKVLQNDQTGPCDFCTNDKLLTADGEPTGVYAWEFHNPISGFWCEIRDRAIRWVDDRMVRLEIAMDITQRKRAEEALRQSEGKYRTLFENAGDAIFLMDGELFTDCNSRTLELFGCKRDDIIGKPPYLFSPAAQPDGKPSKDAARERINAAFAGNPQRFYWKHIKLDGTPFDAEVSLNNMDIGGKPVLQAIVRDITERKKAEEALMTSEELYRTTIDSFSDMIYMVDRDMRIVMHNQSLWLWANRTGIKLDDVVGKHLFEVFPFLPKELEKQYDQVWEKGKPLVTEESTEVGGRTVFTETRKIPIKNARGKVERIVVLLRDITERKRAEQALKESEEKFRNLVERANDGVTIVQDAHIRYVNPRLAQMVGYSVAELVNKPFADFIDPAELPKVRDRYRRRMAGEEVPSIYETVFPHKDGHEVYAEINAGVTTYQGKSAELVFVRDITERNRAEQALRESEERYRELFENANDLIQSVAPDGKILYVNRAWRETLGYSKEEVAELTLFDIIHPDSQTHCKKVFQRVISGEKIDNVEAVFVAKDGRKIMVEGSVNCRFEEGKPVATRGIFRDVTERRKAVQMLRESEKRFRLMSESTSDYIALSTFELNPKYVYLSPSHRAMGYEPEDLIGQAALKYIHPEDRIKLLPLLKKYLTEKWKKLLSNKKIDESEKIEFRFMAKSGEWRDIESTVNYVEGRMLFVSKDITERKQVSEALAESEERFRNIAENALEWIWEVDASGKYTYASPVVEQILGYKREEVLGKYFYDLFHPEDREELKKAAVEAFAQKQPFREFINRNVHKDGRTVWLSTSGIPILDKKGNLLGYRGADTDVTERKRAEQALKESEERYRAFTEEALVGIYIYSNIKGGYLFVNPAMERITGYSRDELFDMDPSELAVPENHHILAEREKAAIQEGSIEPEYTIRIRRKDGSLAVLSVRTHRVLYDGEDVALGNCIDITERVRQQEQIEKTKQEWERTFDTIEDQVVILDRDYRILRANRPVAEYLGLSFQQLVGKPCYELFQREAVCLTDKCPHSLCIKTRSPVHYESKDSRTGRDFSVYISPMFGKDGEVIAVVEVSRDITERNKMQQQLLRASKLTSIGVLAAGIAHQVNNPLAIMLSSSAVIRDILADDPEIPEPARQKAFKYLDMMKNQVDRTRKVVSGLLAFTQIRHSKVRACDVNNLVKEALQLHSGHLSAKNINLIISLSEELPTAQADPVALQQVVVNLVQNAFDAIEENGEITVGTSEADAYIQIIVADNGPGVPQDLKEKIFEPLYTTKTKKKGTGLGLSVSVMLLERFGGRILVEDTPGGGATFTVDVPKTKEKKK